MDKVNKENNTSGHIQLDLTYDEVNLLRECMKRTEDYYRGLIKSAVKPLALAMGI